MIRSIHRCCEQSKYHCMIIEEAGWCAHAFSSPQLNVCVKVSNKSGDRRRVRKPSGGRGVEQPPSDDTCGSTPTISSAATVHAPSCCNVFVQSPLQYTYTYIHAHTRARARVHGYILARAIHVYKYAYKCQQVYTCKRVIFILYHVTNRRAHLPLS